MTIPKLFDASATSFSGLGLGFLAETIDCTVTEERNGSFECELTYPISGNLYDDIVLRNIIYVDVNTSGRKEPFRIYRISRPMNGIITVNAAHISYDLSGVLDLFFSASSLSDAMQKIKAAEVVASNFTFSADFDSDLPMSVDVPTSIRSILGGMEGSLIDTYGGELDFENFTVSLKKNRGRDRGVVIRYGKNLTDIKQDEDSSSILIDTIELDEERANEAIRNIKEMNLTNTINVFIGNAVEILPTFNEKYDIIFIDAAKGKYPIFLKESIRLSHKNTIILADNILYKGYVMSDYNKHKQRTAVTHLREYIKEAKENENLETTILEVGDGLAISKVKE